MKDGKKIIAGNVYRDSRNIRLAGGCRSYYIPTEFDDCSVKSYIILIGGGLLSALRERDTRAQAIKMFDPLSIQWSWSADDEELCNDH
jgi:hypothetical protein